MSDFDEIFGGGFNAQEEAAKAAEEYAPIPPGWYQAVIEAPTDGKPMVRDSKAGGKMLKLVYRITGPTNAGRKVFANINLIVKPASADKAENAKKAEQIGRRELAKLCVAAGKPLAKDSAELVDAAVEVKVVVGKNYNGDPDNEVKDVRKIGAQQTAAPSAGMMVPQDGGVAPIPATPAPAPAQAGTPGKLPWMK
jgi:hypothetical protein